MSISDYAENKILDHTLGGTAFAQPAGVFVKLHVGDPGEAGANNPASETTRKAATFAAASGGSKASNADVQWTNVAATETYSHVSLWDASTGGNCLWYGPLTASVTVTAGGTFTMASGSLIATLD